MIKIATHNSGTGEKSRRWWHKLVVPFARCQSKNIIGQFDAGARYFDLRIRQTIDGEWCFAHGLWESASDPWTELVKLNETCIVHNDDVLVSFTYEGSLPDERDRKELVDKVSAFCETYRHLKPVFVQVRKPSWETLRLWRGEIMHYRFSPINFNRGNWRWLLPIPWLWWMMEGVKPRKTIKSLEHMESMDAETKAWQFVDFL